MNRFEKNKINWRLLAKYLSGETDNEETVRVNEWININSKNRKLFDNLKNDWKKINTIKDMKKKKPLTIG